MAAAIQGHLGVAKMLVDHGAEIGDRDNVSSKRKRTRGVGFAQQT